MTCADVQARLVDLLYGELDEEALLVDLLYGELDEDNQASPSAHLERCADCGAAWLTLQSVSSALDRWTAPAPRGLAERALATLAAREAAAARAHNPGLAVSHVLGFLLAGAAAAAVSLLLISGAPPEQPTPLTVGLAGAVWAALYGGASFLAQHGRYRRLALAALIAAGVSVLGAPVLSMPAVIEACRRWLEAAQGSVALNGLIVLAGALYAAAPVSLSSAFVARPRPGGIWADAVRVASLYGLLLAPSVYLQCYTMTLSQAAPWVAGVLLGSLLGSTGGITVALRLRPASA
ncbi:MAG: zf-HC2 domain-containing protein [Candidatus Rokubacteria bacterium]|nr:zf-HC2 domain-containing protein [Candidatus Rokubacteria bacterium]